jgi:hypothetical protein
VSSLTLSSWLCRELYSKCLSKSSTPTVLILGIYRRLLSCLSREEGAVLVQWEPLSYRAT